MTSDGSESMNPKTKNWQITKELPTGSSLSDGTRRGKKAPSVLGDENITNTTLPKPKSPESENMPTPTARTGRGDDPLANSLCPPGDGRSPKSQENVILTAKKGYRCPARIPHGRSSGPPIGSMLSLDRMETAGMDHRCTK